MMKRPLRILQVNTSDGGGGAETFAYNLHRIYREKGCTVRLVVDHKLSVDPDVVPIPNSAGNAWLRFWFSMGDFFLSLKSKAQNATRIRNRLRLIGQPKNFLEIQQGHESFEFPGSRRILDLLPPKPDIIHCHNLHGPYGYFDLRALPWLSQQAPLILTMHDAWLLSGHCAHSFGCQRWKTGCGQCPDLTIYPEIKSDATAYNWRLKRDVYLNSKLYVSTPSNWLIHKVQQSNLAQGIVEARVIPNGVDLSVFHPANKQKARKILGIPEETRVLLFVAAGIRQNPYKDYQTLKSSVAIVAERLNRENILFLALGEKAHIERIGKAVVHFIPYQHEPLKVACYYQATDIYLHGARVDTFPNTVIESLACGTPVVATAVGGIPEQIRDGITGFLTPPGNADVMADKIIKLLEDEALRQSMGRKAVEDALRKFDIKRTALDFMGWYREILKNWKDT